MSEGQHGEDAKKDNATRQNDDSAGSKQDDADFLKATQTLKAEQAKLAEERTKLEADKKAFIEVMKSAEQGGRAAAGQKEPTADEKVDAEIKQMFKGTGLNPLG